METGGRGLPGAKVILLISISHRVHVDPRLSCGRVPATILIAIGAIIPAITSGLNRFGDTSGFFLGEFLGVVFLFLGFLVSIEVFQEFRVPF